jgi:parvulin-like peptidyl-prolyl isomerase
MKLKTSYVIVINVIVLLLIYCEKQTPVARVGNYFIYATDLKEAAERNRRPTNTLSALLSLTNTLAEDKLKLIDAYLSGFEQDSVVVEQVKDFESRQVYSYIMEHELIGKIITKGMLKERYHLLSNEWHVRHIFLQISADSLKTIETLKSLRSRALRGEDFGSLARKYSKDSQSAGKNGDLGFIKYDPKEWGKSFSDAVAGLSVGHVSPVIQSDKGFHLIKLEQVRESSQQPFEEEKNKIRQQLIREKRSVLDSTYYSFKDDILARYNAEILEDNVDSLLSLIQRIEDENSADKVNMRRDPGHFAGFLREEEKHFPLARFEGGAYVFGDLLSTYEKISPMRRPSLTTVPAVLEFLDRNVPRTLIVKYGYEKGLQRRPSIRDAVHEERERLMIGRIRYIKINKNLDVPEEELLNFYQENLHHFENDIRVNVQEIVVSDSAQAYDIYKRATSGEDFDHLAEMFNEREETQQQNGVLGFITQREYGPVSQAAVKLKQGEISEPIKNRNRYSIVKVLQRESGEPMPFDEVKFRIRRDKRVEKRNQLYSDWMNDLKESYAIAIYPNVIKNEFEIADE